METASLPTCFIVMPISVPKHLVDRYGGRVDHFKKVCSSLIEPAAERAGLQAISPTRTGTENIQAAIINDLQGADFVLADLSGLNPNVFLELGIRSALDRPVCLVWDGLDPLPFDSATLNTHRYDPQPLFELNAEIQRMADFISATVAKSDGRNELWKFFGSAADTLPVAELDPEDASMHAKLDRVIELLDHGVDRTALMPRPTTVVTEDQLREVIAAVNTAYEVAAEPKLHGTKIGTICRSILGDAYQDFLQGESLSSALVRAGIPLNTDSSGFFLLVPDG